MTNKKIFISYSWQVQERVVELAERLIANGVDVVLDVYDLKEGQDKYAFMEQSVNDPSIDRVLIICDKSYTEKANSRSGGVGDETIIISPEIYGKVRQEKFIPVIFESDENGNAYCPTYINSRIYIDLSTEDNRYEEEYEKLIRNIYEKPIYKKPALGTKPEWLEDESIDFSPIRDTIKQIKGFTGGNQSKSDYLIRKACEQLISIAKEYSIGECDNFEAELNRTIDSMKIYRDIFIDLLDSLILTGLPIANTVTALFEKLYNDLHDSEGKNNYYKSNFEEFDFLIWELYISTTAILLYNEKYTELYDILTYTYFLKENYNSNKLIASNYTNFRAYCRTLEEQSSKPRLITYMGDKLIKRERKPIITKSSISNADLVLYQMYPLLNIDSSNGHGYWFPITYIYHCYPQNIWIKMQSKHYCEKIKYLFGANNIKELKDIVSKSTYDREMHHSNSFYSAYSILSSIKIDDIGSVK